MRKLRIVSRAGDTEISDSESGEPIEHVTSVEVFQVGTRNPVFAVIKVVGTVTELDVEAHSDVEPLQEGRKMSDKEAGVASKPIFGWVIRWQSKTLWFNLISAVLAGMEMSFHFVKPLMSDGAWGGGMFAVAMVNVVLRVFTNQPLATKVATPNETERPV